MNLKSHIREFDNSLFLVRFNPAMAGLMRSNS